MGRRIAALPARLRPFTTEHAALPRALLLTGARGVGKTTFLLHHAKDRKMLYISAENPLLAGESLYDVVKSIFLAGYEGIVVDEIHYVRDWSIHAKAIYDDFPEHSLWISDSSSLVLRTSIADLSRRFLSIRMPLLSFREFLYLEKGELYPVLDPFLQGKSIPLRPTPDLLGEFRAYRALGTRPFYAEGNVEDRLLATLDKTLYADIPFFLPSVTNGNLRLMKAITATLAASKIPRLQVSSLCADWGIGAAKLYQILEVMESVGVLRIIRIENDHKARSIGAKLFFSDPAMYTVLKGDPGTAREALVAACCAEAGWSVEACKDEMAGDFVLSRTRSGFDEGASQRYRIEVGGAKKQRKQADFVIRDDIDFPGTNALPLWTLGMMY
jgi:hypothetical protein